MPLNISLLGAGRIGQTHAQAITADRGAALYSVAEPVADLAAQTAARFGTKVMTIEECAADPAVDAVAICTPTNTHADLIEAFARAGKAIFCEKPIDLSVSRVRACLDVVAQTGASLMLGFNRRFDPHFAAVHSAIADGKIGDVEQVTIISRDPGLPPMSYIDVSGGIFRDMMIHDFDMARFMLGEEIATVQATGSVLVDPEVKEHGDFDTAMAILTTPSGRQCTIQNSRRAVYGYDQRVEVHGSRGAIAAENQRPVSVELATAEGYTRPPLHDFFMTRYTEAYAAEIATFVAAVNDTAAPSPSGQDGLAALILAEAALLSVHEGRRVNISEIT